MGNAIIVTLGVVVGLIIAWVVLFVALPLFVAAIKDLRGSRRFKKAQAGKLRCQESSEKCPKMATHHTPHGFFCEDHEGKNSIKYTTIGSWSWSHKLQWTWKGV